MKQNGQKEFSERVRVNKQKLSSELRTRFDYIVCGAGSSGSVVAARLASDQNTQVLLLEAGGADETDLITDPNNWPKAIGTDLHWDFVAEPNPHLNGRAIPYSMGKALGGGSSVNVSTWSRGHKADWDFYAAESGDPSWSYEAVLIYTADESKPGVEVPVRIIAARMGRCMCSLLGTLTRSPLQCWKELSLPG